MTSPGAMRPTSVDDVRDAVRAAAADRAPLRIAGAGTWLDAGRPVVASATLSLRSLAGIVEYVPGDLTLTARAGTPLADIARATAEHAQWLALDPFGDAARGTIGATVATASAGPLAHAFGTPRDTVLGLEFVTGDGAVTRGGGRVVKNVAGFELTRLLTGAWGTLGVITEISMRLRARPAAEATLAVAPGRAARGGGGDRATLEPLRQGLARLPFTPFAAQVIDAALAARLLPGTDAPALLLRLGGNVTAVRAQREQAASLGAARDVDAAVWDALRAAEPPRAAVVRLSYLPSHFVETWTAARHLATRWRGGSAAAAFAHGDPGRGVVRVVLPLDADDTDTDLAALRALLEAPVHEDATGHVVPFAGTHVFERLPAPLWPAVAPGDASDRLSRGVRRAFDPHHLLNPGILGETA